jgi:hypothetical protein
MGAGGGVVAGADSATAGRFGGGASCLAAGSSLSVKWAGSTAAALATCCFSFSSEEAAALEPGLKGGCCLWLTGAGSGAAGASVTSVLP